MVSEPSFPQDAISSVRTLLAEVRRDAASVIETQDAYEHKFAVEPRGDAHCSFSIGFSTYGTYGLWFWHMSLGLRHPNFGFSG